MRMAGISPMWESLAIRRHWSYLEIVVAVTKGFTDADGEAIRKAWDVPKKRVATRDNTRIVVVVVVVVEEYLKPVDTGKWWSAFKSQLSVRNVWCVLHSSHISPEERRAQREVPPL